MYRTPQKVKQGYYQKLNYIIYYYVIYFIVQIIAARLDEMISDDKKQLPHVLSCIADEANQRELQTIDEEEDFLDESKDNFNIT